MRSRRLKRGQQTQVDVRFYTAIDGPGRHGEVVNIASTDPVQGDRTGTILSPGFAFYISVSDER